jgi:hypothetical protein
MNDFGIWRYLSLAKYIDLVRTQSLYFPKASLFQDETEGKWWGHANLYENAVKWAQSPANVRTLEHMLERAGDDPTAILREINKNIPLSNHWVRNILLTATRAFPHKRKQFIEDTIASWKRQYGEHNNSLQQWRADMTVMRDSTYISCWNRAASMSLAMWEMYGGGRESVAVLSTRSKLEALIKRNSSFLEEQLLEGAVADVEYIEGLKTPNEDVQDRIYDVLFERDRDYRIGVFSIKPSFYAFEEEVRAILYAKGELFEPIEDPHPNVSGFHLSIGSDVIPTFIEKVYLHPMLASNSMMVQTIKELNNKFGLTNIPVVADKIEAMSADVSLPDPNWK